MLLSYLPVKQGLELYINWASTFAMMISCILFNLLFIMFVFTLKYDLAYLNFTLQMKQDYEYCLDLEVNDKMMY